MHIPDLQIANLGQDLQLAYLDSWSSREVKDIPPCYTTILALHGVGFNSAIFSPIIPHLPPSVRLIAYNQRSYRGSTTAFRSNAKGGVDATATYLRDFVRFVRWSIENLGLPGKRAAGEGNADRDGGIVVLSWSKGTVIPISLLALLNCSTSSDNSLTTTTTTNSSTFPNSFLSHLPLSSPTTTTPSSSSSSSFISTIEEVLTSHINHFILFEPPGSAFSRAPSQDFLDSPFAKLEKPKPRNNDESVDGDEVEKEEQEEEEERKRYEWSMEFARWVGGYGAGRTDHENDDDEEDEEEQEKVIPSQLEDFDRELVERGWQYEAVEHGFSWSLSSDSIENAKLGELAIRRRSDSDPSLNTREQEEEEGRRVSIGIMVGSRTVGYFSETVEMIRKWIQEDDEEEASKTSLSEDEEDREVKKGGKKRIVVKEVKGTNHFGFVHRPKEFVEVLFRCVEELK